MRQTPWSNVVGVLVLWGRVSWKHPTCFLRLSFLSNPCPYPSSDPFFLRSRNFRPPSSTSFTHLHSFWYETPEPKLVLLFSFRQVSLLTSTRPPTLSRRPLYASPSDTWTPSPVWNPDPLRPDPHTFHKPFTERSLGSRPLK